MFSFSFSSWWNGSCFISVHRQGCHSWHPSKGNVRWTPLCAARGSWGQLPARPAGSCRGSSVAAELLPPASPAAEPKRCLRRHCGQGRAETAMRLPARAGRDPTLPQESPPAPYPRPSPRGAALALRTSPPPGLPGPAPPFLLPLLSQGNGSPASVSTGSSTLGGKGVLASSSERLRGGLGEQRSWDISCSSYN